MSLVSRTRVCFWTFYMMATLAGLLLSFSWSRTSESAHCFHSQVEELQESNNLSGMAEGLLARHDEEVCRRTEENTCWQRYGLGTV